MERILLGIFFILHGLVHLLYFGQSARYFELKPGMIWPDGAWTLARLLDEPTIRITAAVFLALAAAGFVAGGAGLLFSQAWWRTLVIGAALFSTVVYVLFWNGRLQALDTQGGIGILINLAVLAALLVFRWPRLAF